ncbi:MAG: hypothetical protein JNL98_15790 [Bryobacterales bacterium]|nr:hypothetical protein [Bryobacterales bacterium]
MSAANAAAVETLRTERKLRLIQGDEEGEAIDFLPGGVYGFSYSPHTEGTPLFSRRPLQSFEVHKLADESVHYVGYMTEEDAKALAAAEDAVDVSLYPATYEKAQSVVSVAKSRILKGRPVSRENGNYLPLTVSSKH